MSLTSKCDSCIHQDDCEDSSNHALMHVVDGCGDYECGAKVRTMYSKILRWLVKKSWRLHSYLSDIEYNHDKKN